MEEPEFERTATAGRDRLRQIVDAGIALGSELDLDGVLTKLVETAAALTDSRYAALGVLDKTRSSLERFITFGIDDETRRVIGEPPSGRGILGALIRDARPLRLTEIGADPRSVGFPPGHPPMRSFLGVPVLLRGVAFGNLYLAEKARGEQFTEEDEEFAVMLASQAAVAIENARLYETATAWTRRLESLAGISKELAAEIDPQLVLERACEQLRDLVNAETALIVLVPVAGRLSTAAIVGERADAYMRARLSLPASKAGRVLERGRAERIDSAVDDPEIDQRMARQLSIRSAIMAPMRTGGGPLGLLMVFNRVGGDGVFTDGDLRLTELFAERVAQAIELSRRVSRDALEQTLLAQEDERRRLGRELHDDAGQMLAAIRLGVRRAARAVTDAERDEAFAHVTELVDETAVSLRRLSHQLSPRTLESGGLDAALAGIGRQFPQSEIELVVASNIERRLTPEVETALFRLAQEGVTNIVKHAHATQASIILTIHDGVAVLTIEDNGRGFTPGTEPAGLGLATMRARIELVGGTLDVLTEQGGGTTLRARVPV